LILFFAHFEDRFGGCLGVFFARRGSATRHGRDEVANRLWVTGETVAVGDQDEFVIGGNSGI
jgi:hypothetical protein